MTKEELLQRIATRCEGERLDFNHLEMKNTDFSGCDLSNCDFSWADFENCCFDGAILDGSSFEHGLMPHCSFRGASLRNVCLSAVNLRWSDFTDAHAEGANFFMAVMEYTVNDGIVIDDATQWYRMHCPETGAFVAYKKCFDMRLVQLLVPADARRVSPTSPWGRCDKAKVLSIWSFDGKERFTEATSLQTDNFVYPLGEWVEEPRFNPDRWLESAPGIHFWMTRQEAFDY